VKTTRQRLIEYMQAKRVVSTAELARVLKLTAADIRHHLASLEDEGVVQVVDSRVHGRGRPAHLYGLSIVLNRHNLDGLANAVLGEWLESLTEEKRDEAFDNIASQLLEGYPLPYGNLTQRLTRAVRQLNDMNYQARWEAHITAPRVLVTHCPYASVVAKHPETCRIDELLLGRILGQPVSQISKQEKTGHGEVQCLFRISIQ
jgi:predicted ArsR family transcriptional regulator